MTYTMRWKYPDLNRDVKQDMTRGDALMVMTSGPARMSKTKANQVIEELERAASRGLGPVGVDLRVGQPSGTLVTLTVTY